MMHHGVARTRQSESESVSQQFFHAENDVRYASHLKVNGCSFYCSTHCQVNMSCPVMSQYITLYVMSQ